MEPRVSLQKHATSIMLEPAAHGDPDPADSAAAGKKIQTNCGHDKTLSM